MRGISRSSAILLVAIAMPLLRFPAFADNAAPTPPAGDAKILDLKEAQSRLAKAASPAEYAAMLDSFSTALIPPTLLPC